MSITSTSASLSIHAAFLALLFLLFLLSWRPLGTTAVSPEREILYFPNQLLRLPTREPVGGGGGGGGGMVLPAAQGMLPPANPHPFVPPQQVRANEQPLLELPPALELPPDTPNVKLTNWGDPLAQVGPLSDGRGKRGGIGDGGGDGVGDKRGPQYGQGDGPDFDGVRTIGGGVTAPRLVYKIEPEYSAEARKAKYQGAVTLRVIVDERGAVRHVEVAHPLGMGLDEKAVEAVRRWRFEAGLNGKPVPVWAVVEVFFRLL